MTMFIIESNVNVEEVYYVVGNIKEVTAGFVGNIEGVTTEIVGNIKEGTAGPSRAG